MGASRVERARALHEALGGEHPRWLDQFGPCPGCALILQALENEALPLEAELREADAAISCDGGRGGPCLTVEDPPCWEHHAWALEAEVERLKAELDALGGERATLPHCSACGLVLYCSGSDKDHEPQTMRERDEARAEVERLKGELRAAQVGGSS